MALRCQRYHLVISQARGRQGGSAYPDVTLLPLHITGPAMLSYVLSHLPGLSSKSSSVSNQRLNGGGLMAKEPKQKGGRFYQQHPHSKTCQSNVRHLLSHSPTIPPQLGQKGHQAFPSGISHVTS